MIMVFMSDQDEEPLSIRAQGMGGIVPLPVQDPSVVLFNPAGLGWREGGNVFVLAGILQEKGPKLRMGLEHQISNRSALRAGYKVDHFTLGATLELFSGFDLDYAVELEGNGGTTHYLGLTFGRPRHVFYRNDLHRVAEKAEFGEDRFALVDDHNLHYVESGKGRPLVLITPFAATYRIWKPLISSLPLSL